MISSTVTHGNTTITIMARDTDQPPPTPAQIKALVVALTSWLPFGEKGTSTCTPSSQ